MAARLLCPGAPGRSSSLCSANLHVHAQHGRVYDMCTYGPGRWEANARAVHLADVPHRVLTRPARVFDYSFLGMQKARGRENILRLEARFL